MGKEIRYRTVHELVLAAFFLSLGATVPAWPTPGEPDPYQLAGSARRHLARGELESTDASLRELNDLISAIPEWDPDLYFSDQVLPQLGKRLSDIREVLNHLDLMVAGRVQDLDPPSAAAGLETMDLIAHWARSAIHRIQAEVDRTIAEELERAEDRAVLFRTREYAEIHELLDGEIMARLTEAAKEEVTRLLAEDERTNAIRTRLDVVKRSTIDLAIEQEKLREQVKSYQNRENLHLEAMASLIQEGTAPPSDLEEFPSDPIGNVFSDLLDRSIEAIAAESPSTEEEISSWRANVARYRHYNRILSGVELASDQGNKIDALERSLNRRKAGDKASPPPPPEPFNNWWFIIGLLGFTTVLFGWMAMIRSRKPAISPRAEGDRFRGSS